MTNTAVHVLTGPLCKLWEHRFPVPGLASIPSPAEFILLKEFASYCSYIAGSCEQSMLLYSQPVFAAYSPTQNSKLPLSMSLAPSLHLLLILYWVSPYSRCIYMFSIRFALIYTFLWIPRMHSLEALSLIFLYCRILRAHNKFILSISSYCL